MEKSKILIVDDRQENILALSSLLSPLEVDIHQARSGKETLDILQTEEFAVILLDVKMPDMDGFETTKAIKQLPKHKCTPVILVTAIDQAENSVKKGYELGAVDYLFKPFESQAVLSSKVGTFIDLYSQKKELERASQAKGEFFANMSHELRTPLNAIVGMSELLRMTPLNDDQQQYVQSIERAGDSLVEVINDILDLSKIEAQQLEIEKISFNLEEVFQNIQSVLCFQAQKKGLALKINYPPKLPKHLIGDPTRLKQIFMNLVNNAIKFTEQGFVALSVQIESQTGDEYVLKFLVEDTGSGIPKDRQQQIFDPFIQASSSTARSHGGTGLGLPICKKLVECMGGKLSLMSELEKGSTFSFTLTLEKAHQEEKSGLGQDQLLQKESYQAHVLMAEDNIENQIIFRKHLQQVGCTVEVVQNGEEALNHLKSHDYDLVLMDIQMPVMDGYTAVTQFRKWERQEKRQPTPIIALTAFSAEEDLQKCLDSGCDDTLTKPFKKLVLFEKLQVYLK